MKTNNYRQVLAQSAQKTAVMMTAELRQECLSSGWPSSVVSRIRVKFEGNKFIYDIPEDLKNQVGDLEYGTPSKQLSPALHRYGNRTNNAESFLLKTAGKLLK